MPTTDDRPAIDPDDTARQPMPVELAAPDRMRQPFCHGLPDHWRSPPSGGPATVSVTYYDANGEEIPNNQRAAVPRPVLVYLGDEGPIVTTTYDGCPPD